MARVFVNSAARALCGGGAADSHHGGVGGTSKKGRRALGLLWREELQNAADAPLVVNHSLGGSSVQAVLASCSILRHSGTAYLHRKAVIQRRYS